tara:strand:+ start:4254 stop:4895 length:642 start_codon:yes stop_codon:yes gene_type:complete
VDNINCHRVGILIYTDAEVLDFAGPFEVFSTAARLQSSTDTPLEVVLIAEEQKPVNARGGFTVTPHYSIDQHPPLDTLIVAGGVHTHVMHNHNLQAWLQQQSRQVINLASVCTGVFLLAQAGVIDQLPVTTHWQDQTDLQQQFPHLSVLTDRRWVDVAEHQPRIVSSGGISAGIDMSLFLLSQIQDQLLAQATARQMEFDWPQQAEASERINC